MQTITKANALYKQASLGGSVYEGGKAVWHAATDISKHLEGLESVGQKLYNLTPNGRKAFEVAKSDHMVNKLYNLNQKLKTVGIDPSRASAVSGVYKNMHQPSVASSIMHAALSVPLAAAVLGIGGLALNKADELKRISGYQDPITHYAIHKGLSRAVGQDPELTGMNQDILHERGSMLYKAAPSLFEPENREVLRNTLLRIKDMGGADANVLREVSDYEKSVGLHHQKYQQYADIGSTMLGN